MTTRELVLPGRGEPPRRRKTGATLAAWSPAAVGVAAVVLLTGLYLGIVTLTESWTHAVDLLRRDAPFDVPIMLGFGLQAGLFTALRAKRDRGTAAVTGVSGTASTLAMIVCCAQHLADALPLAGLSGAAVFLAAHKTPFLALGLVGEFVGVSILLTRVWQSQAQYVLARSS